MQSPSEIWNKPSIHSLREDVNRFSANYLTVYNETIKRHFSRTDLYSTPDKTIYDSLLGNLEFCKAEIILLDSPLLQRLRQIKQLGFADLVFPSVTHSRFEHTLGVTDIAGRMARKIQNHINLTTEADTFDIVKVVRLAAIFHDVGHMFSSHVSETFFSSIRYSKYEKHIRKTLKEFSKEIGLDKCPLSELISCLILVSPSVTDLLQLVIPCWHICKDNQASHAENLAAIAACLILGLPINAQYLPYSKIISGDIDADKCDYLRRDSARTGIPVSIDVDRIVSKIRVIKESLENKTEVWTEPEEETQKYNRVAIEYSARRCVDDIAFSRIAMFEKVYYHHKVCTAETMFLYALSCLDSACPQLFETFEKILTFIDSDFRCDNVDEKWNFSVQQKNYTICNRSQFDEGLYILKKLSCRDLLYRCTAFNLKNIVKISTDDADVSSFFQEVIENTDNMEPQIEFLKNISQEKQLIKSILQEKECDNKELYQESLPLLVKTPNITISSTKTLFTNCDTLVSSEEINTSSWHNSRANVLQNHYIVCDRNDIISLYLATRKVLYTKHNLLLTPTAYKTCRIPNDAYLSAMKKLASDKRYFENAHGLYDVESVLKHRRSDINKVITNASEYSGALEYKISSPAQIYSFIGQFVPFAAKDKEIKELCNDVLNILLKITIFGRDNIVSSFKNVMQKFDEIATIKLNQSTIHTIGSSKDSSQHIAYYFNDFKALSPKVSNMDSIPYFLETTIETEPLVFFDDAFSTGVQLISIFQELLGVSVEDRKSQESHCTSLSQDIRENFLKRKIFILYCLGSNNKTKIEQELKGLGLDATIIYGYEIEKFNIFHSIDEKTIAIFKTIGKSLLADKKEKGWSEDKIAAYSLGYNNAQLGIVYPWNTPSFTVTALWRPGKVNGADWKPLFPRQSK